MYHSRSNSRSWLFGEVGIDRGEGDHVEGGVPGGEPGIFPFVGHREDVAGEEVLPVGVAAVEALRAAAAGRRVALQPVLDDVVVELLGPEQAGIALAEDQALLGGRCSWG